MIKVWQNMRSFLWLTGILLLFCCSTALRAQSVAGFVVEVTDSATIKEIDGRLRKVSSINDFIPLNPGQSIRASGRGIVRLRMCNNQRLVVKSAWFNIPRVVCLRRASREDQEIIRAIFSFGGSRKANRAANQLILFPDEALISVVRPESFVIRWRSILPQQRLQLSLAVNGASERLWTVETDGEATQVDSDELRRILKDYQNTKPNLTYRLTLIVRGKETENTAVFRLVSARTETELQEFLLRSRAETGIFAFILRSVIYQKYNLFFESAEELERALEYSPDSEELLRRLVTAHDLAGNIARRDELEERLTHIEQNRITR
jgi:hypothetical protein